MRTDIITVSSSGSRIETALEQVEKVAAYKGLDKKSTLWLRLLTEEMMGMMRSITGETQGKFWIEDEDGEYRLHLQVNTWMDFDKREKLLNASTSGKNEAAKGLMGRLRNFFDQAGDSSDMMILDSDMMDFGTGSTLNWEWSMNAYRASIRQRMDEDVKAREIWDELEQSVVTHVADEVKVSIRGGKAELIILKKL